MSHRENISSSTESSEGHNCQKSIGSYILGQTIGEGTFGKVKLAKHVPTGENVAIKILDKEKMVDNNDMKRVKKELSILQCLKHINIIQLYEIIHTPQNIYLIMEYADGGELFDYISSKKKLSELEACKFFQQMINSLEYLHKMNIVHRDLKPENLLLDSKKMIKVSDFGLSTKYSKRKKLKTACGTPSYAPPEMINGEEYEGLKSDIWSSGVILYAMIVGYLPFYESNEDIVCQKILQAQFEFPNHVSEVAKDLIKRILVIDPEERLNLEQIKSHQFFNLITPVIRPGIVIGMNKIPVDENILEKLKDYNLDTDKVRKCLEENELNQSTATYYLVMRKIINNGGYSISDLYSDAFLQYVDDKNNILCEELPDVSEESEEEEDNNQSKDNENYKEDEDREDKECDEDHGKQEEETTKEKIESKTEEKCDFLTLVKDKFEENLNNNSDKKKEKNKNYPPKKNNVKIINIFNEKFRKKNNKKEEKASFDDSKINEKEKGNKKKRIVNIKEPKIFQKLPRARETESRSKIKDRLEYKPLETEPKAKKKATKNYSISPEKIYRALKNRDKVVSPMKNCVFDDFNKGLLLKKLADNSPVINSKKLTDTNSFKKEFKDITVNVINEVDEYGLNDDISKKSKEKIVKPKIIPPKPISRKSEEVNNPSSLNLKPLVIRKQEATIEEKEIKKPLTIPCNPRIFKKDTNNTINIAKVKKTKIIEPVRTLVKQQNYNSNKETKMTFFTNNDLKQEIQDIYGSSKNTRNPTLTSNNALLLTNDISFNLMNYYTNSVKGGSDSSCLGLEKNILSTKSQNYSEKRFIFNDEEVKYYCGLTDINCCFYLSPESVLERLIMALNRLRISFIQPKKFKVRCSKTGLNFDIEICNLIEYNARYLKIKRNKGETINYLQLISSLLNEMHSKDA